jgi:hypothetical protein
MYQYVNNHLVVMERGTLTYEGIPVSDDESQRIDRGKLKPKEKSDEEYLGNFLGGIEPKLVSTSMIGRTCTICYGCYLPGEFYRELRCGHDFHRECVDRWLGENRDDLSCPMCRCSQYIDDKN